jgi:hypothetical protein
MSFKSRRMISFSISLIWHNLSTIFLSIIGRSSDHILVLILFNPNYRVHDTSSDNTFACIYHIRISTLIMLYYLFDSTTASHEKVGISCFLFSVYLMELAYLAKHRDMYTVHSVLIRSPVKDSLIMSH